MDNAPGGQEPPATPPGGTPWPPAYGSGEAGPGRRPRASYGAPASPATDGRRLVSLWTKRIAWLGLAAVGLFSFVAARSVPGKSPATTAPGSTSVSQSGGSPVVQPASSGSAVLQPASQPPAASFAQPVVRSGGS